MLCSATTQRAAIVSRSQDESDALRSIIVVLSVVFALCGAAVIWMLYTRSMNTKREKRVPLKHGPQLRLRSLKPRKRIFTHHYGSVRRLGPKVPRNVRMRSAPTPSIYTDLAVLQGENENTISEFNDEMKMEVEPEIINFNKLLGHRASVYDREESLMAQHASDLRKASKNKSKFIFEPNGTVPYFGQSGRGINDRNVCHFT